MRVTYIGHATLLLEVAAGLQEVPDRMILSGLLAEEADEVARAFERHGLVERERRCLAEWAALLLVRAPGEIP